MIEYLKIETPFERDVNGTKKLIEGKFRNETVESMKTYDRARQETAREILKDLNNRYNECGGAEDVAIMLYDWLSEMGKKYGIEEE